MIRQQEFQGPGQEQTVIKRRIEDLITTEDEDVVRAAAAVRHGADPRPPRCRREGSEGDGDGGPGDGDPTAGAEGGEGRAGRRREAVPRVLPAAKAGGGEERRQ